MHHKRHLAIKVQMDCMEEAASEVALPSLLFDNKDDYNLLDLSTEDCIIRLRYQRRSLEGNLLLGTAPPHHWSSCPMAIPPPLGGGVRDGRSSCRATGCQFPSYIETNKTIQARHNTWRSAGSRMRIRCPCSLTTNFCWNGTNWLSGKGYCSWRGFMCHR